ncbi:MAG TPA: glycosyltransferase family 39 protein [Thermodesulfobacteriota bacterium]|nr:glycosyltransferase family 39 protein [Thermodesulfobacteriota bacterium]
MIRKFIDTIESLNEKRILLLLIGVTFALRLYAVLMAQGIANDSAAYGFVARDFLKGDFVKGLSSAFPPLYPFLIFLFSPDAMHVEITGRLLSLFFGTFALIPLFYLVKEAIGREGAILTGLLYAFHPYLVTSSGMLLTEATYWGLLTSSVYFFWTGLQKQRGWRIALSGCFLGLAYLTRPEGIGYVLVYLAWVIVDGVLRKEWLKKLMLMGILIPSVLIFVIPYVMSIHQETGQWLISKKAVDAQSRFLERGTEEAGFSRGDKSRGPAEKNSKILDLTKNVGRFLPSVAYHYFRAYHFSLWLFLFFGLTRMSQTFIAYEWFLASFVLFHLVSLSTFLPSTIRFSIPVIPVSLFWAGAGILEIKRYLGKTRISNPEKVAFLLILLVMLVQLPESLKPERRHRAEQKRIGLWLRQNTPPDAVIMSNSPQETFYANREFILLPRVNPALGDPLLSYDEILHYAKTKGVRYILVDKNSREMNPNFVESIQSKDLKERFSKADQGVIIYEVVY